MSKAKNAPKKEVLALGNTSLSTVGEFIPVFRKKRNKKQITTKRAVQSYPLILVSEEQKQYYLGKITVGSTSNILPETFELCRISFKHSKEDSIEIILTCGNTCIVIRSWNSGSFLKDAVQTKMFSFDISTQGEIVYFKLYLISIPLPKFYPKIGKCIKAAFALFYDINTNLDIETNQTKTQVNLSNIELKDLYEKIVEKREGCEHFENEILCIPQLKPKLRKYQEQAVNWMIYRETIANDLNGNIHPLYQKITLKSNIDMYLDKYTGWIEKTPPIIQCKWKGGILADEMGLGKTVEIFALILKNKMNKDTQTDVKLDVNEDTIDADSNDTVIIIKRQLKKRKSIEEDDDDYRIPEKMKKVPEPTRGKSSSFQALQSIYNHTLSEYCTTKIRKEPEEYRVQCICGSTIEDGSVECEECGKWQHSACLGWKRHLGEYKCPQCWETSELLQTKATLIVVPSSLRKQWCREMKTHLKAGLKVLNYEGYAATPAYPTELLEYDIVITTYNVLQAEMRLTETSPYINLRKQRKYWPSGSPLVRMYWWRLCLDEAQTVETPGRMVSLMARKISACHRWAVTGTPIARGLTDIYGLIDYLKIEPYCDYDTWKNILYDPYLKGNQESMYNFLSKVLWRTSKNSVLDQINIPKQTHELHLLEFSAVEKFFYNREHEICAQQFLKVASNFDSNLLLEKMDKSDLKNLMNPLLSLRQACSDPSTVRGKGRYVSLKKNTSSMKDLLEALILKNRHDCEESLRLMVSSINGLAGIYLLMDTPEEAIKEYRKVLQLAARFSVEEKKGKLTIDKLPLIHTMYNLAEVLEKYPSSEHTLRDTTLREDCADLEKQYIEKFMKETAAGKESCVALTNNVEEYEGEFVLNQGKWYSDAFDWVELNNLYIDLVARVELAAANAYVDCDLRCDNTRTLLRKVYNWHLDLDDSRDALFAAIEAIYNEEPETKNIIIKDGLVAKAMDCHLRPHLQKVKKKGSKCLVCVANVKLKEYESKLFIMKQRGVSFEEMCLVGSWKPRLEEILLKTLLGLLKTKSAKPNIVKDGENHVLLIETLKKEFKEIRKLWTLLDQQVCAQDELNICKVRLQLKTEEESKDKTNKILKYLSYEQAKTRENINLIRPAELPYQELSLRSEESRHNTRLETLLGTRNYLETLKQQQFEGCNPDPCPICRSPLMNTWAILPCAHTFCLECFQKLLNKACCFINCCVCRLKQNLQEVAYIRSGVSEAEDDSDEKIPVVGNYSRKVEAVVRLLLKLRIKDPQVKVLLFSTWSLVLKLLKKALEQNDITVELSDGTSAFEKRIESFKDSMKKITVLLLPLRLGAKGLNLIEATHVILLEPVLNPADELQAIGRVHRIGQTKPTVVHKFLVRNTIEESLHEATTSNAASWEKGKVTVGQLQGLFKNLGVEEQEEESRENVVEVQ